MAGNRFGRPTLKSAGKARLTTIRDILREIEEDEARELSQTAANGPSKQSKGSLSASPRSQSGSDISNDKSSNGGKKIVVRIPSAVAAKPSRRVREKRSKADQNKGVDSSGTVEERTVASSSEPSVIRSRLGDPYDDNDNCSEPSDADIWNSLGDDQIHFLPKLLTERGSVPFHKCMDEMKSDMKKRKQRREGFKAAIKLGMMLKEVGERKAIERENEQSDSDESDFTDETDSDEEDVKQPSFGNMSRNWKILNINLKEQHLQKKKEEVSNGWNLLSHTINQMTNEEKARQDLYEKYIYKPNSWADGLVNKPKFLQERTGSVTTISPSLTTTQCRPQTAQARVNGHQRINNRNAQVKGDLELKDNPESKYNTRTFIRRPKSGHV